MTCILWTPKPVLCFLVCYKEQQTCLMCQLLVQRTQQLGLWKTPGSSWQAGSVSEVSCRANGHPLMNDSYSPLPRTSYECCLLLSTAAAHNVTLCLLIQYSLVERGWQRNITCTVTLRTAIVRRRPEVMSARVTWPDTRRYNGDLMHADTFASKLG